MLACALLLALIYGQFRGDFTPKTELTMLAARAGLVMDQGSKVTYNGVSIGRVAGISEVEHRGKPAAEFTLDVDPKYVDLIPVNVIAKIQATTRVRQQVCVAYLSERPITATDHTCRRD